MSKEESKPTELVKSANDILEEQRKEVQEKHDSLDQMELRKNIVGLLQKNFDVLENRQDFKDTIEEKIREKIADDDDDVTMTQLVRLYEVISNSEGVTFASISKMLTDVLKNQSINLTVNNVSQDNMTKEQVDDLHKVLNYMGKMVQDKK
jgi:hypothetical protein